MIVTSKTPLRISFFGGGTDYPEYFESGRGAVVGMAIDKYIYISVLKLQTPLEYRYKLAYSKLEQVSDINEIQHPVMHHVLKKYEVSEALDIGILADLPSNTGLGSSSSFTVGFIHAISKLRGRKMTKYDLARAAISMERDVLKERVGVQDQLHASFGGINRFDFENGRYRVSPVQMSSNALDELSSSLVLAFTGQKRHASATLKEQLKATADGKLNQELDSMLGMVDDAVSLLETQNSSGFLKEFAQLLDEGWRLKRQFSAQVTNSDIDQLYEEALRHGALGGKLCGAGGGGFLLLVVPPENRKALQERLPQIQMIPIGIDPTGSTITQGQ